MCYVGIDHDPDKIMILMKRRDDGMPNAEVAEQPLHDVSELD